MENKWVIGIDLDGTTLMKDQGEHDEDGNRVDSVHPRTIEGIKLAREAGHEVVIATGRNWREAKPIYDMLGMDGFIINSAGAHIHNPNDSSFEEKLIGMDNGIMKELLNDSFVMDGAVGYAIDEVNDTYLKTLEKSVFNIAADKFWDMQDFDGEFSFDPQSSVIYIMKGKEEVQKILDYCREKWGEEIHFTYWGTLETPEQSNGIELNPAKSNKGTAVLEVARQLGIPAERTMGFGDGENDLELIRMTSHGVKMANGVPYLDAHAKDVTKFTNNEGGVGEYLIEYFKLED